MIAVLWLSLLFLLGHRLRRWLIPDYEQLVGGTMFEKTGVPRFFFGFPAASMLGIIPATTLLFFITSLCSRFRLYLFDSPLLAGLGISTLLIVSFLLFGERKHFVRFSFAEQLAACRKRLCACRHMDTRKALAEHWPTFAFFIFVGLMIYLLFCYVFYTENEIIYSGSSVVSDYAPHLANISAFVRGDNYTPTDYPVFAGAGMRYHFFFFFFTAALHALGMNLTFALNLASAIGLLSFAMLMSVLAVYFCKRKSALFWIQPLLFFQSSLAWISYLRETITRAKQAKVSCFSLIFSNQQFIGDLTHDEWGLWNMNVYANQRHLLFGLAAALLVLILFLPTLKGEKPGLKSAWFSKEAWLPDAKEMRKSFIAAALILLCLPYWHGAVTIALLLLLLGLSISAQGKLGYLLAALLSLAATLVYSQIFSGGTQNIVSWKFQWGFLSADKSLWGIVKYLFTLLGLAWPALLALPFVIQGRGRKILSFSMWLPLVFAMTISLTPDINVNHKYIIMTRLLLCLAILACLNVMFRRFDWRSTLVRGLLARTLAVVLGIVLTLSGFLDQIAYINKNRNRYALETSSKFVQWLEDNTDERAIFLTPTWFYHSFFYSGRQAWYAYPYYAWSAGYDSVQREKEYKAIWTGFDGDLEYFKAFIRLHRLEFALIDQGMRANQAGLDEDFFIRHFPLLREFPEQGGLAVYDLRPYLEN